MAKQIEYVVEGAKVKCSQGTMKTTLKATSNSMIGNQLRIVETDTQPVSFDGTFGNCKRRNGEPCAMVNLPKWFNTIEAFVSGSNTSCVTKDSFAVCTTGAGAIAPVDSGQVFEDMDIYLLILEDMDERYPGLRSILDDPNGSLYLNEGMVDLALQFLSDKIAEHGGSIDLSYFGDSLEDAYIRITLQRLAPTILIDRPDQLLDGTRGLVALSGLNNGANGDYLDEKMMEVLRNFSKDYSDKVEKGGYYKWQEENKANLTVAADIVQGLAYAALASSAASNWKRQSANKDRVVSDDNPAKSDIADAEVAHGNKSKVLGTRAELHQDLLNKGYRCNGTSKGGYVTYMHPDGRRVDIRQNGEVIGTKKEWKPDGSRKIAERYYYDGTKVPHGHNTWEFVEPVEAGAFLPPKPSK